MQEHQLQGPQVSADSSPHQAAQDRAGAGRGGDCHQQGAKTGTHTYFHCPLLRIHSRIQSFQQTFMQTLT